MTEPHCCAECFGDKGIKDDVIPSLSDQVGQCDYCRTDNTLITPPAELGVWFEMVLDVYKGDPDGFPLLQLLQNDWGLFNESAIDRVSANELLKDILQDQNLHQRLYSPATQSAGEGLEQWRRLREEMLHRNRWFLPNPLDPDRIREWLGHLIADRSLLDRPWFRARLLDRRSAFTVDEMGAPPPHLAQHGRANPAGIPYLYLGSSPDTGVAEIRPHRGERVCVAKFGLRGTLRFIDLRDPRPTVSPFIVEDSDQVQRLYNDLPLLEQLGQELTRPVLRQSTAFDYTPSQFLCELIKSTGFDGVLYGSSVSDGMNLAVFDPEKASATEVEVREVSKVEVQTSECSDQ